MSLYLRWIVVVFGFLLLLFVADVAYAHDCSGPDDCANVVTGTGITDGLLGGALGAAAAIGAAGAGGRPGGRGRERRAFGEPHAPELPGLEFPNLPAPEGGEIPVDRPCT